MHEEERLLFLAVGFILSVSENSSPLSMVGCGYYGILHVHRQDCFPPNLQWEIVPASMQKPMRKIGWEREKQTLGNRGMTAKCVSPGAFTILAPESSPREPIRQMLPAEYSQQHAGCQISTG